jgi:hypothetical protein
MKLGSIKQWLALAWNAPEPLSQADRRRADLLVLVVGFLVWLGGIRLRFYLDDIHNLESALLAPFTLRGLAQSFSVFDPSAIDVWCLPRDAVHYFRPLFVLSLKLDHLVWGQFAQAYHLTNLALHLLNAWMVHRLLLLTRLPARAALLGACLFAAFPHHTVAVLWISGRTEVLLGTFVLGALLMHARALVDPRPLRWRLGSLGLAAGACLTKEGAVVLPGLLVLLEWLVRDPQVPVRAQLRPALLRLWPVLALIAAYLVLRLGLMGLGQAPPKPYYVSPLDPGFVPYVAAKTMYYYLGWLTSVPILPVGPVALMFQYPLAAVLVALLVLAGWWRLLRRLRDLSQRWAWLAWTGVALLPTAPVMSSNHYTYLANAGVAVLWASVLTRIQRPRWRRLAFALVGLACLGWAWHGVSAYDGLIEDNRKLVAAVTNVAPQVLEGDADLYLVNVPFLGLHTGQELRLLRGAKGLRTHLVTVSSAPFGVGTPPKVERHGPDSLTLTVPPGWIDEPLVQMFLMMGVELEPGKGYSSGSATIVPRAGPDGKVAALDLSWPPGLDASRRFVIMFSPWGDGEVRAERL